MTWPLVDKFPFVVQVELAGYMGLVVDTDKYPPHKDMVAGMVKAGYTDKMVGHTETVARKDRDYNTVADISVYLCGLGLFENHSLTFHSPHLFF
jgi:hypothetical protein